MTGRDLTISQPTPIWTRSVIAFAGLWYFLAGGALLLAPDWFFRMIGYFPPFNRHYMGDTGSFLLPLGVGLMLAARDPMRHSLVIQVAALGSLLHMLNHVYDLALDAASLAHWLVDLLPLAVLVVLLVLVGMWRRASR